MKTSTIDLPKNQTTYARLKKAFTVLNWYPFVFTAMLLLGGLFKSHSFVMFAITTLVLYMFIGSITWFVILICLLVRKKISIKQIIQNIFILSIGILTAYYVLEYDILASGAKYID